jgi:phosphoglycolate phosphatase
MLPFKALLFDLDGTLLDTAPDFISAIQQMLKQRGLMPLANSELRNTVTNGSAGIIEKAFGIDQDDPQFKTLQDEFLSLYFDNIADKTTLFSGLKEVLDTCTYKCIAWGIVTNKPWKYTQAVLEQLNPSIQPATTICPDHVAQPKPDPEGLLLACSELSLSPSECIYIGDHIRDIQAGRSAGMRTIAAGWGYIDESENIAEWQADWIIEESQDLNRLLFEQII